MFNPKSGRTEISNKINQIAKIIMRKIYYVLLMAAGLTMLNSCSKDDETEDNNGTEQPEEPQKPQEPQEQEKTQEEIIADSIESFKELLCGGYKFVHREQEDGWWHNRTFFAYVPVSQTDYIFNSDGTGMVKEYHFNSTAKGYIDSSKEFTWTINNTLPVSVSIATNDSFLKIESADFKKDKLMYKDGALSKERIFLDAESLVKDSVISYSVDGLWGWYAMGNIWEYPEEMYWFTPATLTVKTKAGIYRFIRGRYAAASIGQMIPHTGRVTDMSSGEVIQESLPYEHTYAYMCVANEEIFYDILINEEEVEFIDQRYGSYEYFFHIGDILKSKSGDEFMGFLIQNTEDYKVEY